MKYLNKDVIIKLNEQQKLIIDSSEELIMVEACPGAGKTYTIVNKIQKELELSDNGVIACSFTNEASEELKKRISRKVDTSNCFIGTIDSFILSEIVGKFINRYLKLISTENKTIEIENVIFPNDGKLVNELTRMPNKTAEISNYCNKWWNDLLNGTYEISFPSYMLATKIVNYIYFNSLYTQKYSTIYIDEAQDLNYYQHVFIKKLREKTGIKVVMVGDSNQSIYQFRGANPALFKNLEQQGYKKYNINVSVRCHPSISYYANKLVGDNNYVQSLTENRVKYISSIDLLFLKKLEGGFFIICETNKLAVSIYNEYKDKIELYYIKSLDIDDEEYTVHRDLIDKILKYYFNYNNVNPKKIYPKDEFYNFLININPRIKESDIEIKENEGVTAYISKILQLIQIKLSNSILEKIENKLLDDIYKYYYYETEKNNRVMTIHASKGLENNNVILLLENRFSFNIEYKNKLFVAITRAIDNVYLLPTEDFVHLENITQFIPYET